MKKLYLFFIISSTFIFFSLNANTVNKSSIDIDKQINHLSLDAKAQLEYPAYHKQETLQGMYFQ